MERMTDPALAHVAEETRVFARISPAQKNRILLALKHNGHAVGFMGDGINDAPSLHAADVGISVFKRGGRGSRSCRRDSRRAWPAGSA